MLLMVILPQNKCVFVLMLWGCEGIWLDYLSLAGSNPVTVKIDIYSFGMCALEVSVEAGVAVAGKCCRLSFVSLAVCRRLELTAMQQLHTYITSCMCTAVHAHTCIHKCMHKHIHMHTCTCTHTHMQILLLRGFRKCSSCCGRVLKAVF